MIPLGLLMPVPVGYAPDYPLCNGGPLEADITSSGGEDDAFHEAEVGNPETRDLPPIVGDAPVTAEDAAASHPLDEVTTTHARRWVIGAVAAVVAIVGVVVAILLSSTSAGISTGSGTATITWTPVAGANPDTVGNPPQPFTGTIDGITLAGIATTPLTTSNGKALTGSAQLSENIFRWKGTFGGKPFNVGVYLHYQPATAATNPAGAFSSLTVSGKWGNERVIGRVVTPSAAELKRGNAPLHFTGTVGDLNVSGMVLPPVGGQSNPSSTATFTVSR